MRLVEVLVLATSRPLHPPGFSLLLGFLKPCVFPGLRFPSHRPSGLCGPVGGSFQRHAFSRTSDIQFCRSQCWVHTSLAPVTGETWNPRVFGSEQRRRSSWKCLSRWPFCELRRRPRVATTKLNVDGTAGWCKPITKNIVQHPTGIKLNGYKHNVSQSCGAHQASRGDILNKNGTVAALLLGDRGAATLAVGAALHWCRRLVAAVADVL